MDAAALRATLSDAAPPAGLPLAVQALWWDARGDWDGAHRCAMADDSAAGAAVHAYLHRKEGDPGNAGYWYRRAGRPVATSTLDAEWESLAAELGG